MSHSVSLIFTRVADRVAEHATRTCFFFTTVADLTGLSHVCEIVLLAQEGDLKALGWLPTNRPLARPVVSREEPPARPVGHRGKKRARESAVKNSHLPTTSATNTVCGAAR